MGKSAYWATPEKLAILRGIKGKYSASDIRDLMNEGRVYTQKTGGGPTVEVKAMKITEHGKPIRYELDPKPPDPPAA